MGSFDRDTCTYHATSIHRDENNCPWCSGWIPKQEPIEQSYQQLTEVAREMWHYVVAHNTPDVPGVDMSVFETRLEELGVEL